MVSLRSRGVRLALKLRNSKADAPEWVAAGHDQIVLKRLAAKRRRLDSRNPSARLLRHWARHRHHRIDGRSFHVLSERPGGQRVVLYLHAGAYVFGPSPLEWNVASKLANRLDADLALFDYPKVPESNANRTISATRLAWDHLAGEYGAEHVVVMGASAGGGLTASLLMQLRDDRSPQPAGAVMVSPWLDVSISHPEVPDFVDSDLMLSVDGLRHDGELYAADRGIDDPYVSPWFGEVDGLAPMLVTVGGSEILLPEDRDFVDRVNDAGGSATLVTEHRGQHIGALMPTPEGGKQRHDIRTFARDLLA